MEHLISALVSLGLFIFLLIAVRDGYAMYLCIREKRKSESLLYKRLASIFIQD